MEELTCPFNDGRWCKRDKCMLYIVSDKAAPDCGINIFIKKVCRL